MSKPNLTAEAKAARDALRSQTIGAQKVFEPTLVDVFVEQRDPKDPKKLLRDEKGKLVGTKVTYALVPPTIHERGHMLAESGFRPGIGAEKPDVLQAHSIIACCRVPGFEDVHAYDATDFDNIISWPAGGWPDRIYPEIQKLMARSDIGEAKKNSEETGASASSSSSPEN